MLEKMTREVLNDRRHFAEHSLDRCGQRIFHRKTVHPDLRFESVAHRLSSEGN